MTQAQDDDVSVVQDSSSAAEPSVPLYKPPVPGLPPAPPADPAEEPPLPPVDDPADTDAEPSTPIPAPVII